MDISVIIINFQSEDLIKSCLNSLKKVFGNEAAIYIVDNSEDSSKLDELHSFNKNITVISPGNNIGFAKANNIAANQTKTEYLLFLNPDTVILEDFLSPILNFIEQNKNIGACAPMLVYENMKYQSSTGFRAGTAYEFLEAFMLITIFRKLFRFIKRRFFKNGLPIEVGWVSAACMILRKDVFDKVSGFSEDYFLNYEDIDLCRRIEDAGYKNYYFPAQKCVHLDHRSFKNNFEVLITSRYKSRLIYSKKYYSFTTAFLVRIMHLAGLFLRISCSPFIFRGIERKKRLSGYLKSLKMLLAFNV